MGRRGTSMAEGMNVVGLGGLEKVDVMSPAEESIHIINTYKGRIRHGILPKHLNMNPVLDKTLRWLYTSLTSVCEYHHYNNIVLT